MVTDPAPETISGAAAQVEKEAAEREAVASDAGKNATGLLNSMMSSLPHIPRSRDELVTQINNVEANLKHFYQSLVDEAENSYPQQVDSLKRISARAMEQIDNVRKSLTPALEQAREQVAHKTSDLSTTVQAKFPVIGTLQAQATNIAKSVGANVQWAPSVDLIEMPEHYLIRADLPGSQTGEVSVLLKGTVVTIEGNIEPLPIANGAILKIHEMRSGKFSRSIALPEAVREELMSEIKIEKGILEVTIPKSAPIVAGKQPVH